MSINQIGGKYFSAIAASSNHTLQHIQSDHVLVVLVLAIGKREDMRLCASRGYLGPGQPADGSFL